MKILMLVNWKVLQTKKKPMNLQPPDYSIPGEPYWFFRYFEKKTEVDVIDIHSMKWIENFEKNKLHFYVIQTIRCIFKFSKYDLIISHGMQSGVLLSLIRRFRRGKEKHFVFEIGSFNSAAESGKAQRMMQVASKSIDGIIYHTSKQRTYYENYYPWLVKRSQFIRFGTDLEFFSPDRLKKSSDSGRYIICVGYHKRDWDTLIEAYKKLKTDVKLKLVGKIDKRYEHISGIEQLQFLPINELISQIYNALFCVLPLEYLNYSFGQMTLMQQMALGKLVVVSNVPSVMDYVRDRETALLYQAANVKDCRKKMLEALQNKNLRERIGQNARKYLLSECNEKIMAQQIEQYIKKRLEEG